MNNESINQQTEGDVGRGRKKNQNQKKGIKAKKKKLVLSRIKRNWSCSSRSCCLFVKQFDSSCTETPTSDPNSSDFTFDSLKGLIENSDFFLNECNTHFDDP